MAFESIVIFLLIATEVYSSTDPCNRPSFCISGDDPEIVADPDDCKKFFQCLFNHWAHLTCSGASTFDSKSKRCVSKDATCFPACPVFTGYYTESATAMPPGTPENCTGEEIYPDASSCHSYYLCDNGSLQHKFCEGFTPVFDIHKLECTLPPADFDCQYRCKTAGPNPDSCLHYFYCTDGQWGRIRCPRGYLFDWSSAYCRDEEVICHPKCPPKPTPVEPGLCETVTSCVVGEKFPDRASCIHFWECIESEGILERKMCGAQLPTYVFDIDQRECVQPDASFDCEMRCLV
ncbi:hypothetical protein CAPTEDRAFT_186121 [Capitella teleta]|uniref:Chitin-binding type-2 domain-containing protein n=1 Tax=Capitella teleta TaxID=283909 RepID=R7VA92_CAPTE|nr:hypothetical protein CAPTEDRAFT_186121 [Capitella teleta]|eukprot:ELU15534.1 hypothetical protein CAPTEDRAFT_186121 [Capitella teleta]